MVVDFEEAYKILKKIVLDLPYQFKKKEELLNHSYLTGKKAYSLAQKLQLNAEEIGVAGLFHDIGKGFTKDKIHFSFHEIYGAIFFEEEAIKFGITNDQEEAKRIAQSFRSHFLVYEQFFMSEYKKWLSEIDQVEYINVKTLLPRSWNEIIICYADLTNYYGRKMSFEERLEDMQKRDSSNDNPRLNVLKLYSGRLLELKKELDLALAQRRINKKYVLL